MQILMHKSEYGGIAQVIITLLSFVMLLLSLFFFLVVVW